MATTPKSKPTDEPSADLAPTVTDTPVESSQKVVEATFDAATKNFDKAVDWSRDQLAETGGRVEAGARKAVGQATAGLDRAAQWGREHLESARTGYRDALTFSRGTADDLTAAGKAAGTGAKALGEAFASFAAATGAAHVDVARKLFGAKNLADVVALHGRYTATALDLYLDHAGKITKVAADAVHQVAEPLRGRLAAVAGEIDKRRPAA